MLSGISTIGHITLLWDFLLPLYPVEGRRGIASKAGVANLGTSWGYWTTIPFSTRQHVQRLQMKAVAVRKGLQVRYCSVNSLFLWAYCSLEDIVLPLKFWTAPLSQCQVLFCLFRLFMVWDSVQTFPFRAVPCFRVCPWRTVKQLVSRPDPPSMPFFKKG